MSDKVYVIGGGYVSGTCGTCRFWVRGTQQDDVQDQVGDCHYQDKEGHCTAYLDSCNSWKDRVSAVSDTKKCQICGKPAYMRYIAGTFCSPECALIYQGQENAALRAKLEAANGTINLREEEIIRTDSALRDIEQERDDLCEQLETANQQMNKKAESWRADFRQVEQERDNLQAAYTVVRSALEELYKWFKGNVHDKHAGIPCPVCAKTACHTKDCVIAKCQRAYLSTPAEAGEWVRGLVEALEAIETPSWVKPEKLTVFALSQLATEALTKYRGGGGVDGLS